jgi:4-hydroxy-3-methylbut-2-enyl diphosphate reductase
MADPSGFCAGVESAVKSLAWLVALNPPPVVCVHAVVHNEDVVTRFEALGVEFVARPEDVPTGAAVLLSAHGSPPDVTQRAAHAHVVVDAACPLVSKVHRELRARSEAGDTIIYVGHRGHDEAEGALAHVGTAAHVVERPSDVDALPLGDDRPVALLAQTTIAMSEWADIAERVRERFSSTWTPPRDDICFATTNRQTAGRALAHECEVVIVVGSATSSNTAALVDSARSAGAAEVHRVSGVDDLPVVTADRIGIVAGASTPAVTIDAVVRAVGPASIRTLRAVDESEYFPLAPGVRRQIEAAIAAGVVSPALIAAYRDDRHVSADALVALVERSSVLPYQHLAGLR